MRFFLPIGNINKIELYMVDIKVHIYSHLVFYFGNFNILKSVLCIKQLAIGQLIILNKSVIIKKRSLVIITSSIKAN